MHVSTALPIVGNPLLVGNRVNVMVGMNNPVTTIICHALSVQVVILPHPALPIAQYVMQDILRMLEVHHAQHVHVDITQMLELLHVHRVVLGR